MPPGRNGKPRVVLRAPSARDRDEYLTLVRESRLLHGPWVYPPRTAADFTRYLRATRTGDRVSFFVRSYETGKLVSVVELSVITGGVLKSAYLGFYAMTPHSRCGYTGEAVSRTLSHAFSRLKLHRVEANIQPGNRASKALVKSLGFRYEGYSPRYLKIGGRWRDHERWAILSDEWRRG